MSSRPWLYGTDSIGIIREAQGGGLSQMWTKGRQGEGRYDCMQNEDYY